ncbi:hypothetical protein AB0F11_29265 [Streptomyces sp. NPDC032472]|uniref:hypothetical protein n=1 Tax=Streptomyces sp. NPDC032472 TaxID=3155018 RepID=UPI00340910D1
MPETAAHTGVSMGTVVVRKIVTGVLVVAGFLATAGVGVSEAATAGQGGAAVTAKGEMVSDATKYVVLDDDWS